jgi:hypothetical protein
VSAGNAGLTVPQKKVLAVALVIHLIMVTLTWRDLRRRPDAALRGRKRLWRVAATVNTTGSVAYWLFGRRRLPEAGPGLNRPLPQPAPEAAELVAQVVKGTLSPHICQGRQHRHQYRRAGDHGGRCTPPKRRTRSP